MKRNSLKTIALIAAGLAGQFLYAQPKSNWEMTQEVVLKGGYFTVLIAAVAIAIGVLFFIKVTQLFVREKINAKVFYLKLKGHIKNGNFDEALQISSSFSGTTLGAILKTGLETCINSRRSGKRGAELQTTVQNSIDEVSYKLVPQIEKDLFWFDILGQIATLLGLMGTIWGLIVAFSSLAALSQLGVQATEDSQELLTTGIYQAMGTTGLGLIVAIPTMILKGFLRERATKIINNVDEYSIKAINQINNSLCK